MAAGDIYRLSFIGDYGASMQGVVTAHVKMLSGGATPSGACAIFKTDLLDLMKTKEEDSWTWRQINWLSANLTPPVSGQYTTGFPIVGTVAGSQPLPATCALVVTLRTSYAGRSYRGRQYWPGLAESFSDGSTVDAANVNAIQTYYDDLIAQVGAAGSSTDYQWGVYSHKLSIFTPITEAVVRNVIATQRRRRPGVGA